MGRNRRQKQHRQDQREIQEERRRKDEFVAPFMNRLQHAVYSAIAKSPEVEAARMELKQAVCANEVGIFLGVMIGIDKITLPTQHVHNGQVDPGVFSDRDKDQFSKMFKIKLD